MTSSEYGSISINTKEFGMEFSNKKSFDDFLILYYELLNANIKGKKIENSEINIRHFYIFLSTFLSNYK